MKLTKIKYKKLEKLMLIAIKPAKISNYKFMCTMLYIIESSCKWRPLLKKCIKLHIVYVKFNKWSKDGTIAGILSATRKQKLFNKENSVLFIDSTSIKMNPDVKKNQDNQEQSIGCSKKG